MRILYTINVTRNIFGIPGRRKKMSNEREHEHDHPTSPNHPNHPQPETPKRPDPDRQPPKVDEKRYG